jgi:hypothetical protein
MKRRSSWQGNEHEKQLARQQRGEAAGKAMNRRSSWQGNEEEM